MSDIWDKFIESELLYGFVVFVSGYGCYNMDLVVRVVEFLRLVEKFVGEVMNIIENRFDVGGEI